MEDYKIAHSPQRYSDLRREHKEALGLLSIGTFLEYFDLMLYVHMAVLLNELFFPKTDPYTEQLLMAFAFCSTYIMRPIGALVFGWLGDSIGRKVTVIITTMLMAISCIIMATLPTYAQIGITATWIITICRIMQGMASMGEIIGADIYLTELTKPPVQYPMVATVTIFSVVGTSAALGVATLVTLQGMNWRVAFWIGAIIALVGTVARNSLRETPVFADAKKRIKTTFAEVDHKNLKLPENHARPKSGLKAAIALFFIQCGYPVCFYLGYIYCGSVLKQEFGFTPAQVIQQNLVVSLMSLSIMVCIALLSYRIFPLKILKVRACGFLILIISLPYLFANISNASDVMLIQFFVMLFFLAGFPAIPVFYRNVPVFKRFTYGAMAYALSRSLMSAIASFGLVYLIGYFGYFGIVVLAMPVLIGFWLGLMYFERLDNARIAEEQVLKDYLAQV